MTDLSPAQLERFAILAEEAGEIVQAVGKIIRHGRFSTNPLAGNGVTNVAALSREVGDMLAIIDRMIVEGDVFETSKYKAAKHEALKHWTHHQPDSEP